MLRQLRPAVAAVVTMTLAFGIVFPMLITAVAQAAFPHQANGSLARRGGRVVGSELIGQPFASPRYFHPRPSAAGSGYDAGASGGTNLGPTSAKLIAQIGESAAAYRAENGLPPNANIPADAATRSASGLDPDISPANAAIQAPRVALARSMPDAEVRRLVAQATTPRTLGLLGEPRVNVLRLNMALDALDTRSAPGRR